jgi:hypothetical protein
MHDIAAPGAQETIRLKSPAQLVQNNSLPQNWLEFLIESSEEERRLLNFGISTVMAKAIESGRAVYLEHFGIIFPDTLVRSKKEDMGKQFRLVNECVKIPVFEKCTDLVSFQRERFSNILEGRSFIEEVAEQISFFTKLRPKKLERYVRGIISLVRYEVIAYGHSNRLSQLGRFLAVHNRQGTTERDWLSGADIFLKSPLEYPVQVSDLGEFFTPILGSAWEPFEALYGRPFSMFTIKPDEEVAALGLGDLLAGAKGVLTPIDCAIYRIGDESDRKFVFVTNGLRSLASRGSKTSNAHVGSELILQAEIHSGELPDQETIKDLGRGPLALGWLLAYLSDTKNLQLGIGVSSKVPVWANLSCNFRSILVNTFASMPRVQHSMDGQFCYATLILLHPDEAQVVAEVGSESVLQMLVHRRLDQINRDSRPSIFGRTGRLTKNSLDINVSD